VVEADIRGFFDNLSHEWLMRMLAERIDDEPFLRLIKKWLKAGVLDTDGQVLRPGKWVRRKVASSLRCWRMCTCTTRWICGSRESFSAVVEAGRFYIVTPTTLSAALDEQKKPSGSTTSWKNGYGNAGWNWRIQNTGHTV